MELIKVQCKKCGWLGTIEKTVAGIYYHQGCPICKEKECIAPAKDEVEKRRQLLVLLDGNIQTQGLEKTMQDINNMPFASRAYKHIYVSLWNNKYKDKNKYLLIDYPMNPVEES